MKYRCKYFQYICTKVKELYLALFKCWQCGFSITKHLSMSSLQNLVIKCVFKHKEVDITISKQPGATNINNTLYNYYL